MTTDLKQMLEKIVAEQERESAIQFQEATSRILSDAGVAAQLAHEAMLRGAAAAVIRRAIERESREGVLL